MNKVCILTQSKISNEYLCLTSSILPVAKPHLLPMYTYSRPEGAVTPATAYSYIHEYVQLHMYQEFHGAREKGTHV